MVCSIVPGCSCGGSVGRGGGVLVALAVVAVLAGLLLEVGFQNRSAQQAELPTAHCEVAQPSVYAVHHFSHLPQLMVGYEVVDDLHVQL